MATTDIAKQLISFISSNPAQLGSFLNHPYSTVQTATGSEEKLSKDDMSQVVTAAAVQASGKSLDPAQLDSVASKLLAANGGSVHALTSSLFGTTQQASAASKTTGSMPSVDLGALVSLAGGLDFSKINLSDGLGLDDIMGAAGGLFGAK